MYEAVDESDVVNPNVAVKCIDIRKMLRFSADSNLSAQDAGFLATLLNEIVVLSGLSSDYVVRYISCWAEAEDSSHLKLDSYKLKEYVDSLLLNSISSTGMLWAPASNIFIKMELCQFTLKYFLGNRGSIPNFGNGHVAAIFKRITIGLNYVHEKGFIHRDIKPGNIFCQQNSTGDFTWKIGDFGLATKYSGGQHYGKVGTREYWSPELKNGSGYTTKTDVFSLGLVFLELVEREGCDFKVAQIASALRKMESSKKRFLQLEKVVGKDRFVIWVKLINMMVHPDQIKRLSCRDLEVALGEIKY